MVFGIMGTNYKQSNIQSALGVSQMKIVETLLNRRIELAGRYTELLSNISKLRIPSIVNGGQHSFQTYCVLVDNRDHIMREMRRQGIEAQIGTYSLHLHPAFQEKSKCRISRNLNGSLSSFNRSLALPLFYEMSDQQQLRVVESLKAIL